MRFHIIQSVIVNTDSTTKAAFRKGHRTLTGDCLFTVGPLNCETYNKDSRLLVIKSQKEDRTKQHCRVSRSSFCGRYLIFNIYDLIENRLLCAISKVDRDFVNNLSFSCLNQPLNGESGTVGVVIGGRSPIERIFFSQFTFEPNSLFISELIEARLLRVGSNSNCSSASDKNNSSPVSARNDAYNANTRDEQSKKSRLD
jgi:hypothetical protein